jgi:acyl-CoA thioesterase I
VDVRRLVLVTFGQLLLLAAPLRAVDRPILVCYGDSITAGLGESPGQAYPADLQRILDEHGYVYHVVNQGTSGATSKDALASLPFILRMHPEIVIVEFGGNDGLRGLPVEETRKNLDQVLTGLESAHINILLAGITLPPDYGPDYIHSFEQVFRDLAARHRVVFVPMLYVDLVHVPETIQGDGIHPTAKGSAIIAGTLFTALKPLMRKTSPPAH